MEIESYIKGKKELYSAILNFLESERDSEEEFHALTEIIDDQEVVKKEQSIKEIFQLLFKIGDSHHRSSDFFNRLVQIIQYLKKERLPISDTEIFHIYKKNKRLLLLIFEHKIITPDESILDNLTNDQQLNCYLFSEIKNLVDEETKKSIESKITKEFNEDIEIFERKCKEGENGSDICKLIRQDSIQEFISYVNQTNLSLTSSIKADFYESNPFLILNEASLIEYAFFYGSIQVIKYLQNNHVKFTPKIFLYAIHSNNPELIEILVESKIKIDIECVLESIKCHHNDITNYFTNNLLEQSQYEKFSDYITASTIRYYNYYYYPDDIISIISHPEKSKFQIHHLASSLTNITIPSSITIIGDDAFSGCSSVIQISIPNSVTSIGNDAFLGCSSLTQISIPSSVTKVGNNVFYRCSSLKKISIPSSVTNIGYYFFAECSSLTQISIPSSVISIGNDAFSGCSSLTQISIPSRINTQNLGIESIVKIIRI